MVLKGNSLFLCLKESYINFTKLHTVKKDSIILKNCIITGKYPIKCTKEEQKDHWYPNGGYRPLTG